METRISLVVWLEKKSLPACLNENLHNSKMSLMTCRMQARGSLLVCPVKNFLPACLDQDLDNLKMPIPAGFKQTRLTSRLFTENKLCWTVINQCPGKLQVSVDRRMVQGCQPLIVHENQVYARSGPGGRAKRGITPARRCPDGLSRACMPRSDGELQRSVAGEVPQADEAITGEGEEEIHDGDVAAATCCVKARTSPNTVRLEEELLPACLDESLGYLKMPLFTRYVKTRGSLIVCREEKGLPACLDECFHNLKMPISTCRMEARESGHFCLQEKGLPACLDEDIRNLEKPLATCRMETRESILICRKDKCRRLAPPPPPPARLVPPPPCQARLRIISELRCSNFV